MITNRNRAHWEERYQSDCLPWDTGITPPEVIAFWNEARLPRQSVALDLGCGTGTNVAYLARLGLQAIGVELAGNALQRCKTRLTQNEPPLFDRISLVQADVANLPFHNLRATYMLDVGCFHAVDFADRPGYVAGVVANLAPGGYYHLYAFDLLPEAERPIDKAPRGVAETEVVDRFAPHLQVVAIQRARPDRQPCRWYLLQKR
jgi:SAM-dependent methyltransferase